MRRKKKEEEKFKKSRYGTLVWNTCMETCLGLCMEPIGMELWYRNVVWNLYVWITCMETCLGLCMESMDLLVRKPF